MAKKSLSDILIESGLITDAQLREAEELRKKMGLPLSSALVYLGFIDQKELAKKIAEQIGLPFIDFTQFQPDEKAIATLSEDIARKYSVFPVKIEGNTLVLAMANPRDIIAIEEIKSLTGMEIKTSVAIKDEIDVAIDLYYKPLVEEPAEAAKTEEVIEDIPDHKLLTATSTIETVDLTKFNVDPNAAVTITEDIARKHKAIPIGFDGGELIVAMANPTDVFAVDTLSVLTGFDIKPVKADEDEIEDLISRYFKMAEIVEVGEEIENLIGEEDDSMKLSEISVISEEAPIVKLVNHIIARAVKSRASDIHIEPMERDVRVRYRIDGVLHEVMRSPKRLQAAIISRFKIMANLDIAERRKPQDGHCAVNISGKVYDFRVATLPTIYGERVVLRVLSKENIMLRLEDLGFLEDSLKMYEQAYKKTYGAILITGPTGSGKSTTLYATLNVLNVPEKSIITVEDPVEYRLKGINQVQINPKAGLNFARVLRAALRAAPDVIMVGEIRDKETAKIAVEAALTGHLVLSTLHTNDAPSAISRLIEMGVEPFLVSSAVRCVQAQRLARRLCPECKEPYTPKKDFLKELRFPNPEEVTVLYRPRGCPKCSNTGYKGRIGIYEIMLVNEEIELMAAKKAPTERIREVAKAHGMRTLREDGLLKAKLGITSVEEVLRVTV